MEGNTAFRTYCPNQLYACMLPVMSVCLSVCRYLDGAEYVP